MHHPLTRTGSLLLAAALLQACSSQPPRLNMPPSALAGSQLPVAHNQSQDETISTPDTSAQQKVPGYTRLSSLGSSNLSLPAHQDAVLLDFSDVEQVQLKADELPLGEFIHQVLDQLLQVSYTLDPSLQKRMTEPVVVNLQQSISQRELFRFTQRLLAEKQIQIIGKDGIFFVKPTDPKAAGNLVIGIGSQALDVPDADGRIMQIVPLRYGAPRGFQVLLKQLFQVDTSVQEEKQFLFIQGESDNIRRALDLLALLDAPASRAREIAMVDLVYLTPDSFIGTLGELMDAEGISLGRAGSKGPVAVIPLPQRQAVVVFASDAGLLQRVYHWARQLDVPGKTTERRYFLYKPRNARAVDMGESLQQLLSLGSGASRTANKTASEGDNTPQGTRTGTSSASATVDDLNLVVDERQNQLMFNATPAAYDKLRPLLLQLDVAPRQVALEVMIAEVTLTGKLEYGLEWFLEKNNYSIGTQGALGLGGSALNFFALDADLGLEVVANLSETENLVKVLSRPRILVTDGDSATVNVGTDIPVLTSTASNIEGGETGSTIVQTVQYRSTGVVLNVTPTVNGEGVVALELNQEISNTSDDAIPGINSPVISQRSFKTNLLVGDGQTAVVGGLISENNTEGSTRVPGISRVPVLGNLFKSDSQGRDRTEIVVMITPRIIRDTQALDGISQQLLHGMERLLIPTAEKDTSLH